MDELSEAISATIYFPLGVAFLTAALFSKNKLRLATQILILSSFTEAWHDGFLLRAASLKGIQDSPWYFAIDLFILVSAILSMWLSNQRLFWVAWCLNIAVPLLLVYALAYMTFHSW